MPLKFTAILSAIVLLAASASCQPRPAPARPVIGVALEGGGALGIAHIGVLEWMEDHHIPIDRLSGTSMGALVGALYATGYTPAQLRAIASSDVFLGVFTLQTPYVDLSYRRRQDRRELPASVTFGTEHGVRLRNALLTDRGVNEFLEMHLAAYNRRELSFDQTPIPFRCVATDLNTLKVVTFASGPLPEAVRASISIPGVFPPVQSENGHMLVDGGVLDNLPVDVLRRELHPDIVIAVRLPSQPVASVDTSSILAVLNRAAAVAIESNAQQAAGLADVVIEVPVDNFSATDYSKGGQLIQAGYLAAEKNGAALMRYALNDQNWNAYLAARASRQLGQPGVGQPDVGQPGLVEAVRVVGGDASAKRSLYKDLKPLQGQPASPTDTIHALKRIQANGGYSATYENFAPAPAQNTTAVPTPSAGILVRLANDPIGPPYLLVGPELTAATSNITRTAVNLRFIDQNFGGFGSEFRGTARLGYLTDLSAEYYRLLNRHGLFVQPRTGILREPVYIWANQKRVAERFQQNLDAGIQAGRTIGDTLEIFAEYRAEDTRFALRTGSGGGPYVTGTAQTGLLHINVDHESSSLISPNGFRISAAAGAFFHAVQSSNAPLVMVSGARTWAPNQNNIFGLSTDINSYLRANVAEPFRFTLGGPRRLSASSFDEYRGTDTALARAGYLRRIAPLPTGLGQGLYAVIGYEAGEIWSPENRAILRQDGALGVVAATPLGAITIGGSVGDAGHRKVFITIGRLF
jgi:NTE family protein